MAGKPGVAGGTEGGTIYLTTADRWGNMVSLVHSVFSVYGSRATVPPYGFVLHNRGSAFSLDPKSPNLVAPRKRPFHTIIAGFVMKDGQPLMTFGNMGGSVQPETHAQHMVNLIDHGMNVQMTTDAARFTHNQNANTLSLETALFNLVGAALKAQGPRSPRRQRRRGRRLSGDSLHARSARCRSPSSTRAPHARICPSTASIAPARITARTDRPSGGNATQQTLATKRRRHEVSKRLVPRSSRSSRIRADSASHPVSWKLATEN